VKVKEQLVVLTKPESEGTFALLKFGKTGFQTETTKSSKAAAFSNSLGKMKWKGLTNKQTFIH